MSSGPELIRPETVALGRGQWEKFTAWVADVAGPGILPSFWAVPSLLGSMMGAYGRHWYGLGGAMHSYRHLIVYTHKNLAEYTRASAGGLVSFEPVGRA